ncbi:MAG: YARHG domain-containing protein [Acidobacteria bacterium]|nr:YARHG domain-containing protein [Acidobacteriota bacterium]
MRQNFEWRDWYKPLADQSKVKLTPIEQQNVNLILARETKIRESLSTEILADESIQDLFTEDLRILRNEIFARRGRVFKDPELQKYFEAQSWYVANADFQDDMLSEIELKNLAKIKEAEELAISKFSLFEG